MLKRYFGLAALAFAVVVPTLAAQEPPQGEFQERVDVNEVLLDVLVTDARGNVIVGLDKGDFVVREDGKPVDITGVTFYSNRRLIESTESFAKKGISVDQVPEDRYFILFFEDQKSNSVDAPVLLRQQIDAGRRTREWVRENLLPNDWVAVASYDQKLKVQQDFTRDRKALDQAIGDAMKGKDLEGNWPSRVQKDADKPSLFAGLPTGKALRDKTGTVYDALQVLADAAGAIRGRKNLLYFGNGPAGRINSFGQYIPDNRYYPPTVNALNDNNVAVYTIDLSPAGTDHTLSDAMNQLANDTGGRYFFNFTNFTTPLRQVTEENSGYYLISYRRERPAGESGFQEVEVKASNPEFRVRARKGYEYGSSADKAK
ncbi:MAG TPA: VWA domain-containing protein [Thermoanaerobaculia bacterium]